MSNNEEKQSAYIIGEVSSHKIICEEVEMTEKEWDNFILSDYKDIPKELEELESLQDRDGDFISEISKISIKASKQEAFIEKTRLELENSKSRSIIRFLKTEKDWGVEDTCTYSLVGIDVSQDINLTTLKGRSLVYDALFQYLVGNTAFIEKLTELKRIAPFKLNCREGMSGAQDYKISIAEEFSNGFNRIRNKNICHISMYDKFNEDIRDAYILDFAEIMRDKGYLLFNGNQYIVNNDFEPEVIYNWETIKEVQLDGDWIIPQ